MKSVYRRILSCIAVILLLSLAFEPALYQIGHRVLVARELNMAGLTFPVPWGWIGTPKEGKASVIGSATMVRMPNTVFSSTEDAALAIGQRTGFDEGTFPKEFRAEGRSWYETRGYRVTEIKEITNPVKGACVEMHGKSSALEITCNFDLNRLHMTYKGDESGARDFYNIIASAHPSDAR